MSLKSIFFLVIGSIIISLGNIFLSSRLRKSNEIINKPLVERVEYFEKLKSLWKMEMIFAAIGVALLFVIFPIKLQDDSIFVKIISIISLVYVIAACGLSVVKYNKFKLYHYEVISKKN